MKILDANMILRFLLGDNREMADKVKELLKNDDVTVIPEVMAEVVFVMTKFYKQSRIFTASMLTDFLSIGSVHTNCGNILVKGLEYYKNTSLDFVDCLLCAYHTEGNHEICTFDKKLLKLIRREDGNK